MPPAPVQTPSCILTRAEAACEQTGAMGENKGHEKASTCAGDEGSSDSLGSPSSPATSSNSPSSTMLAVSPWVPMSMMRSQWVLSDFDMCQTLYTGRITRVVRGRDAHSGQNVVLKIYDRKLLTRVERSQVAREIKLHVRMDQPSVIRMYAAWKDANSIYIALEWAPGGDVYSFAGFVRHKRGTITEEFLVRAILYPFLCGLNTLHDMNIIHRDVKPENILLAHPFRIKIADFGLSIDTTKESPSTRLGTVEYLAPEVVQCRAEENCGDSTDLTKPGYTNKVDCWSTGVLTYDLLCGKAPFSAACQGDVFNKICNGIVYFPPNLSPGAISFIKSLLVHDPKQRSSIAEAMRHPWIQAFVNPLNRSSRSLTVPADCVRQRIGENGDEAAGDERTAATESAMHSPKGKHVYADVTAVISLSIS